MHCGSVRTPDGEVIVLPGLPEAGKSTLTAALIQAGCDYLGDELLGVRPDSLMAVAAPQLPALDPTSRAVLGLDGLEWQSPYVKLEDLRADTKVLGGDVAPIDRIVAARFDPSVTQLEIIDLAPRDALEVLNSGSHEHDSL